MIVVRYQSLAANAVLTHRFESVATPPKRDGVLLPKVTRVPLLAPFGSFPSASVPVVGGCTTAGSAWSDIVAAPLIPRL